MGNQSSNFDCSYALLRSHGRGLRPGVAKDQLIFIIICSVALAVAAVTMVSFFTGGSKKTQPSQWQCLEHGHEFTIKKMAMPPIKCPKCDGEAVRLDYRTCQACGEKVLVARMRLMPQTPGGVLPQPWHIQYWVKQEDGSYAWTPWMFGGSPQDMQVEQSLVCTKCGESLYSLSR